MGRRLCFVCRKEDRDTYSRGERESYRLHVDCDTCGSYDIKSDAWEHLRDRAPSDSDVVLLPYLSAHLRQAFDAGDTVLVTIENWRQFADAHASTSVAEKLRKVLEYLSTHTTLGEWYYIQNPDLLAAVSDMRDVVELTFVLDHLSERGLIVHRPLPPPPERRKADGGYEGTEQAIQLTVEGWETVAPMVGGVVGTCFVAMSFHPDLDEAYRNGIQPGLADAGYRAVRVDRDPHNESITDRIIASIRSAQFVVADFTRQRQGVYYEAGFAQGLGRPVVRMCRSDDFHALHFDTRQFFHLKWLTPVDLRSMLRDHVSASIGPPRHAAH